MKKIETGGARFALVDDEDFKLLKRRKWFLSNHGYAASGREFMHRLVMGAKRGEEVDHINGDTLDNRKVNLRLVTHQQNIQNRKVNKNNKLGYKGVYQHTQNGNFIAQIQTPQRKRKHLGVFATPEDAAFAYNVAAIKLFGEFARLNKL